MTRTRTRDATTRARHESRPRDLIDCESGAQKIYVTRFRFDIGVSVTICDDKSDNPATYEKSWHVSDNEMIEHEVATRPVCSHLSCFTLHLCTLHFLEVILERDDGSIRACEIGVRNGRSRAKASERKLRPAQKQGMVDNVQGKGQVAFDFETRQPRGVGDFCGD